MTTPEAKAAYAAARTRLQQVLAGVAPARPDGPMPRRSLNQLGDAVWKAAEAYAQANFRPAPTFHLEVSDSTATLTAATPSTPETVDIDDEKQLLDHDEVATAFYEIRRLSSEAVKDAYFDRARIGRADDFAGGDGGRGMGHLVEVHALVDAVGRYDGPRATEVRAFVAYELAIPKFDLATEMGWEPMALPSHDNGAGTPPLR